MRPIKYLFVLIMLFVVLQASSQYTTKHYIAPSPWSYFNRYNELVVTTLSTTPVVVTIAASDGTIYTNSVTTVAGSPLRYRFTTTDASANLSGVVLSGQGLYVSASVPIGVQVRNIASDNYTYSGLGPGDLTSCVQKGNSAFTSLGDQGLGTSFRVGYYANVTGQTCYSGESGAPLYSVLAISNNTNIYVNGSLLVTLQAGQSYLFQASMGSLVTSNNNIAVNSGMRGDNSSGCADGVESQVIPTNNLGTTYVVVRSNGNTGYERTTIVATQALTTVTVKVPSTGAVNTYVLTLAGSYITINNGDGSNAYTTSYITSTAPVAVYSGSADGCEVDMIVQPPLSSCSGSFDVQTSQFLSNTNSSNAALPYFGYIIIQSDTAIVWFNGTNLESIVGNRTQIGTTGYYIIKYNSSQLGNPSNLRFTVNARINAALIESGAGYSMSAFISSISNAMPPPSASSSCLPTTFTAQGGFNSYQWYKDGILINGATSQTYTPSLAGSYSVAGTTTACGTTAQSTAVIVNPKPNAGNDKVVCVGQTDTLIATSTVTGGSWIALPSNPTGATLSNTNNNISTVTFANTASGIYNFAFSVGCSDTMSITVSPLPTIATITGSTSVCVGKTTNLSTTTSGGVWASSNILVATVSSTGVVTALTAGTTTISYTVTNANGCSNTVTSVITVNALPTVAAITGTTSACVGLTSTLASTTSGGVWSSSNTSVASVSTTGLVTGVSSGTSLITYLVTNANGCTNAVNTTVTINTLPVVGVITGNLNICIGTTTNLTSTTSGGVWSSSNTSVATVNTSGVVTGISNGTSIITYTVTNANSCVTAVTATVTVNALPVVASISGANNICEGTTTTFTNTTSGGVWSSGTPTVATINTTGLISGLAAGNSVITYTYIDANGCSSSTTRTLMVNARPFVAAISGTNSTCLGSGTTTLGNTTSGGSWNSSATTIATISSSGVVTSVAPGTTTISYTVNGSGGCSNTQNLLFTVKATSASTTNTSICPSALPYSWNGLTLNAAGTYTKTLVNVVGCDSVATLNLTVKATSASTTNTSICPSALPYSWNGLTLNAAGTYTKTLVNAVGCDSIATLNLTVKATSASTTNASICAGGSYTFNGTVYTTAGTYTKTLVNALGCDSIATLNLTVKATSASTTNTSICPSALPYSWNGLTLNAAGTYTKTLVNAVGCDSVATLNLTVKATSASTTNTSICPSALPYSWNGLTLNAAGTYTKTIVNAVGCDSIATLNLTVKATSASTTNASICAGGSYTFNGTVYVAAGTYTKTLVNAVGCDSIATLNLTVKATSASTTNASICAGGSYTFNGTVYTTAGTYTKTLVNALGCDSIATLNLTVKATSASTTNTSICPSALPYSWNGLTLNAAGTYTKTLVNAVGCDSVATLNLTVKATSASITNTSICPSALPYSWNGLILNAAGTYTKTLVNAVGCDSVATLNLTVKATSASTTNTSICPSALPYSWNGLTLNAAGTYTITLVNAVGCDSIATLNLTVKATSASTTNTSICPSALPYSWNGLTLNAAGTYTKTLVNAVGCDSVATLNLTVKATSASTTNASICAGGSYTFNGTVYTTAGTYTKTLVNAVGCDSIATLNLTVKATSASTTNASICAGGSYTFNGTVYISAGTYTKTLVNAVGCDSVATLVLAVKATSASTTNTSICPSALPYSWNGLTLNAAGTYTKTLVNAVGCDSIATLNLTVKATSASTTNASICAGGSYTFNGTVYTTAGTYTKTLVNAVGCDSIATLNLTVKATSASTTNTSICPSALPYSWNGLTLNAAGTYTKTLVNAVGCDSIATLVLTVKATSTSTTNTSICPSALPYSWNGLTLNAAGTYTKTLVNAVGCDSIATLNLTVKATSASTTNASICAGGSYTFNGTVYTTAGTYTKTLVNAVGCDSIATLNLTVKATSASTTNTSICPSALPYSWNGLTLNAAGTYTKTLVNAVGCDSIATLNLTVKATSASTTNASICAGGSYTFNGTVYTTAGTYTKTLVNAVGCDSIATLNLTVKATSASTTNASICAGGSYTFNGTVYTTAGTYTKTLVNAVGCDSIATLNLTVKATSTSTTNTSICPSALPYSWNGLTLNAAGTYTKTLVNAVGCDSVATLNLTVKATSVSTTNASICPSALPYSWNGLTLNAAGTYTKTLVNAVGCDSVATLNLTVKATSASTTNASICAGGSYTFNGTVYTTAGTYTKTLVNAVGCDSIATLNLTVKATSASTTNASICAGGSYTFNGTVYTTAGTYTKTLVNAVGCDSIATLNLTVKATSASTTNTSICPSALPYSWNGLTLNAAGIYTKTLVNAVGCDSIATLVLTVKATSTSTTNTSICPSALPYSWNGLTLNAAGTYTKTLVNAVGCDSIATLNLTVKSTSASTTNASICAGGSYTFNGTVYTTAGTYTKTLVNAVGCDSIATLNLTVKATSASTTNTSICPSALPYSWNGLTLNAAGTYSKTLVNAVGCDSIVTLNLTVKATSASTTTATLCAGNTYSFNGVAYNTPGTYVAHLTNYDGCDSIATLVLVGGTATTSTTTISICPSALPYSWNGLTFTGAGSQTAHLTNASGCDSAASLVLTIKAALTSTTNTTICSGNSYLFNGVNYTTSGTYNAYLPSSIGCDSIATLVLTVLPKPNAGIDKVVTYNNGNGSVTLSGIGTGVWLANTTNLGTSEIVDATNANTVVKNFSTTGTYEYLYINGACSDTMKVTVLPNGNINSYVWVDTNEDGINNESTTNGINNVVIELYKEDANSNYVLVQTTTTATYNSRPGYYNFVIPENGNYKVKFPLVAQGGGLTTQNLSTNTNNNSVADPATGFSPVIAINTTGSGLSLNNTTVGAGYKYVASPNCNMTATIGVNQLSQCVTNNQYQFTGNFTGGTAPFTYLWDLNDGNYANTKDVTHTYATSGEHDVTFIVKDSRGCEAHASTVQIYIGAKPKASFDIYTHSGNGDGFTFVSTSTISGGWMNYSWNLGNGTTSTLINPMTTYSPGTYTVTLVVTGNFGCSDTITKVITVDSSNNYCSGPLANFSVNNSTQCLSGNSFSFTNTSAGNNNAYTWNFSDGTATSSNLNEQHTFANTGTYNITLTATNTCGTNNVTKTITVNGAPETPSAITGPSTVALGGVIGLSNATTGGVWSSANTAVATINNYGIVTGISSGNSVITYTVTNTCGTSSVSIPITVLTSTGNCITPIANFSINTNTQCLAGNNFIFSNGASGTTLTYNWKFSDGATVSSASASRTFTQAGIYYVKLTVSNSCGIDSITKTITVNAAPNQPQAITGNNSIATGGTTTLSSTTTGGVWSSSNTAIATVSANGLVTGVASGSATITYTVTNSCGSASVSKIVLVSQACVPTISTTTVSICAGNSYSFNSTAYTTAGTYVAHLTNAAGCDSTATLVLIIKQPTSSTTTASICAGNSYTFNGTSYTTSGTYTARLTNSVGCDSIATLVLTVNSLPTQPQSITGNASAIVGNTSQLASITSGGVWSSSNTSVATINSSGLVTAVSVGHTIITYTVSNGCGSANVTLNFSVIAAPLNGCNSLKASFSVNNTSQCITDNRFIFTNTTTGGTAPYTYLWEMSEDNKYSTKDATVTFSKYGDAQAKLKVIDSKGCESESDVAKLLIGAKPVASFTVISNTGNGQSKTFVSACTVANGSLSYLWDFGNSLTSTQVYPTITYARGTYTAKLVVSGVGSCKDSVSQVINEDGSVSVSVYPNPVVNTVKVNYTSVSTSQTLVKLVDLSGRIIQTQTFIPAYIGAAINATFDVGSLQSGTYIIQVFDSENGLLTNKIILKQ